MQERDISEELLNVSAATADGGTEHATMNRSAPEAGSLSMMMLVPDLLNLKDTCGESLTSNSTIQQEITPMNEALSDSPEEEDCEGSFAPGTLDAWEAAGSSEEDPLHQTWLLE
ncbi:uncharacterized protein LOC104859720 isoform X3 [Fukomys damarensis]|uniref:uncharacterized protein LOC104859720 isoform X3 n=1 Tax=Fukomys damarensis TaxID=885580 RepID=UPI001455A654|nr:uncharacterized protein LOC104859720 isoform X3 [Fukomys damarensis]